MAGEHGDKRGTAKFIKSDTFEYDKKFKAKRFGTTSNSSFKKGRKENNILVSHPDSPGFNNQGIQFKIADEVSVGERIMNALEPLPEPVDRTSKLLK